MSRDLQGEWRETQGSRVCWTQGKKGFLAGTSGQLCQRLPGGQDNEENKEVLADLDISLFGGVRRAEAWLKWVPERR